MRKRLLFLYFTLLANISLFAQNPVVVVDSISRQPLPYPAVRFSKMDIAFYGDSCGIFKMPSEIISSKDSVKVSVMGYTPFCNIVSNIKDTIYLGSHNDIKEVIITAFKPPKKLKYVGFCKPIKTREKGFLYILGMRGKFNGANLVQYLPNNEKGEYYISKIIVPYSLEPDICCVIRVNLFVIDSNKVVIPLLNYPEYKRIKSDGIYKLDVLSQGIHFPVNGVYMMIEIIDFIDNDGKPIASSDYLMPIRQTLSKNKSSFGYFDIKMADEFYKCTLPVLESNTTVNHRVGMEILKL